MADSTYIATARIFFTAKDSVEAEIVANDITSTVEDVLDAEDGDYVEITQLVEAVDASHVIAPQELCDQLERTRDLLIKTRNGFCFTIAQELDKLVFILNERREATPHDLTGYDYGAIFERAKELLGVA